MAGECGGAVCGSVGAGVEIRPASVETAAGGIIGAMTDLWPWRRKAQGRERAHARYSDARRTDGAAGRRAAGAAAFQEDQGLARLPGRDPTAAASGAALHAALGGARRSARR